MVGQPAKEHLEWWEKCVYITRRWMEITRPGVRMAYAHEQACEAVSEAGLDPMSFGGCYAVHRSHYAHGTGIDLVEEPMLARYEERRIEPGMTLCIEPESVGSEGQGAPRMMHREEIIAIKPGGYDRLTTMGWELHTIPEG